jgi:hypothetical protein
VPTERCLPIFQTGMCSTTQPDHHVQCKASAAARLLLRNHLSSKAESALLWEAR